MEARAAARPIRGRRRPLGALSLTLAVFAVLAVSTPALAEMARSAVLRILAVVNDEPISAFDLDQRLNLIIRTSNLPDTAETRQSLAPRVLRSLIDETLKLQEAKRQNVNISEESLNRMKQQIEKQNDLPPGQLNAFLLSRGVAPSTLERQLKAAIGWPTVVRRRFARTITITDQEVTQALERYKADANKPRHRVAEIFIAVDNPSDDAEARENAEKIIQELRRGGSFGLLARQFSQSASASRGGDLGWVQPGQLDPAVAEVLPELPLNAVSAPIRSAAGYHIVLLRDRRAPRAVEAPDATVLLRQIVVPVPANASPEDLASQKGLAATIRQTAEGCADFGTLSRELGSPAPSELGRLRIKDLTPDLQRVVTTIPIGKASAPHPVPGGLRLIMVCDRSMPKSKLPSRNRVRRRLLAEELQVRARRYLRDLRQTAFIDIRPLQ